MHKQIKIGQSRQRGQPKKTASALVRQQGDYKSSDSSVSASDTGSDEAPPPKKTTEKIVAKKPAKKRGPKPK